MDAIEASDLIEGIVDSLENDPSQFSLDLRANVIGRDAPHSRSRSATYAIGGTAEIDPDTFKSPPAGESSDLEIARAAADTVTKASVFDLADRLRQMARELRKTAPDPDRLPSFFSQSSKAGFLRSHFKSALVRFPPG